MAAAGKAASFGFYRATFRLITVVFDIIGYVTDDFEMDISPDDYLKRALLPLWPAEYPSIWWPPVTNLDVIGGVPGLTTSQSHRHPHAGTRKPGLTGPGTPHWFSAVQDHVGDA